MVLNTFFIDDELLDLVNDLDEVVGQKKRSEIYASGTCNFRAVNAFIVNSQGQLWIPKRSAGKKLFPLCLDASVGGHVKAGETYLQAFERELDEELNINIADVSYSFIMHLNPHKDNVSAHMDVYIIKYGRTPDYNTDDFESSEWVTFSGLQKSIEQGIPVKGDLPMLISKLIAFGGL